MSAYTSAVSSAFRMQRTAMQQGMRMTELGMDAGTGMMRAMFGSMGANEVAQRRSVEMLRSMTHAYLDGIESMSPQSDGANVEELRTAVDESFDSLLEGHAESFDVIEQAVGESLDDYEAMTAETREAIEDFTETLVEQNQLWEDRTVESMQRVES